MYVSIFPQSTAQFHSISKHLWQISTKSRKLLRMPLHYDLGKSATNEFLFAFIEVVGA